MAADGRLLDASLTQYNPLIEGSSLNITFVKFETGVVYHEATLWDNVSDLEDAIDALAALDGVTDLV